MWYFTAKPPEKINKGNSQITEERIIITLESKLENQGRRPGFFLQLQELWDHTDPSDGSNGSGACQGPCRVFWDQHDPNTKHHGNWLPPLNRRPGLHVLPYFGEKGRRSTSRQWAQAGPLLNLTIITSLFVMSPKPALRCAKATSRSTSSAWMLITQKEGYWFLSSPFPSPRQCCGAPGPL